MNEELQPKFESVMIIDDTLIDLYITSRIITKNNFGKKMLEYSEAKNALKYLQDNQENINALPQVIFVDIHMPLMTGFEFMAAYDKLSPTLKNHCKAFFLSSTCDDDDLIRARKDKNVVKFQEKPVTKKFLESI